MKTRDDQLRCRGIRGAILVGSNSKEAISSATRKLLKEMVKANSIELDDVAAVIFTTTRDLNAEFPAAAVRQMGWSPQIALLDGHEMSVHHDLERCLRILMLINTEKKLSELVHVYSDGAEKLRKRKLDETEQVI